MSQLPPESPELLAPAGDWDCLRAAVANGANAVYFGLPQFNARHRATNFHIQELPEILTFLHDRNTRGFVTLNTLIFSEELPEVVTYLRSLIAAGADAVIVQDIGLAHLISRFAPDLPVHASTQMTLTDVRSVEWARQLLGVRRVVLARELSLEEIRRITTECSVPVEVFVHGALCVAYSGQCLTSEALGGRSANRGQCAQACRLPYEMLVDGETRDLGDRAYLLSPQDLAAYELIEPLLKAGVISFKIEGRLKTPEYVAATTQTYRAAMDAVAAQKSFQISESEKRDLAMTFSRGFTPGFLEGNNHQRLVEGRSPKNRGVIVGKVLKTSRRGVTVELQEAGLLHPGDGIVFDLGRPQDKEPGGRIRMLQPIHGQPKQIEMILVGDDFDAEAVPVGCSIRKTDDPILRKRLESSWQRDKPARRLPLEVRITGSVGSPLGIHFREAGGTEGHLEWVGPLEEARKHPLSEEVLREQFSRLGETPYELREIRSELVGSVMVPKSVLNDLRRQMVTLLAESRGQKWNYPLSSEDPLSAIRAEIRQQIAEVPAIAEVSRLSVLVRNPEQLETILNLRLEAPLLPPEMIWLDYEDPKRMKEGVARCRDAGVPVGLATLRIIKAGEEGFLKPLLTSQTDAFLIRNPAGLTLFREMAPEIPRVGDFSMNVTNEITASLLIREGLTRLVPGFDLNWEQLQSLVEQSCPQWFEPVIHQHMPMFHMEHCVFAAFLSTGKDFRDCGRPCDRHKVELRDRVGSEFPVLADAGCRNTVFNSVAQSAAEYLARMQSLGLRRFRVDLLRETPDEVKTLLDFYSRVLAGLADGRKIWQQLKIQSQIGVTRGTLR